VDAVSSAHERVITHRDLEPASVMVTDEGRVKVQVTLATGVAQEPAWSPDGDRLAYASDRAGNWDIWVSQLEAGLRST